MRWKMTSGRHFGCKSASLHPPRGNVLKKPKQSIYTCADAVELQVHLTDLWTMQWGDFLSAPSFFLSFITHLCLRWIPGEPLYVVSGLALCTFTLTLDLWILRIIRSMDLKTLFCAVGEAGGIPQGVGGISKNVAEHIIQTQAAMLTMVVWGGREGGGKFVKPHYWRQRGELREEIGCRRSAKEDSHWTQWLLKSAVLTDTCLCSIHCVSMCVCVYVCVCVRVYVCVCLYLE